MSDTLPEIRTFLEQTGYPFEVWDCDPELADTARYCEHYGVPLENSVNAILVRSKTGERKYALCVLRNSGVRSLVYDQVISIKAILRS